jgi:hypothetical protein
MGNWNVTLRLPWSQFTTPPAPFTLLVATRSGRPAPLISPIPTVGKFPVNTLTGVWNVPPPLFSATKHRAVTPFPESLKTRSRLPSPLRSARGDRGRRHSCGDRDGRVERTVSVALQKRERSGRSGAYHECPRVAGKGWQRRARFERSVSIAERHCGSADDIGFAVAVEIGKQHRVYVRPNGECHPRCAAV